MAIPNVSCGVMWRGSNAAMYGFFGATNVPSEPVLWLSFGGHQAAFEIAAGSAGSGVGDTYGESLAYGRVSYNPGTDLSTWEQVQDWHSLAIYPDDEFHHDILHLPPHDGIDWIVDPLIGFAQTGDSNPRINWPWHRLEMRVQGSSSVGAGDGVLTVLIDGVVYVTTTREIPVSVAANPDIIFKCTLQGDVDAAWIRLAADAPTFNSEGLPTDLLLTSANFVGGALPASSDPAWASWRNTPFTFATGGRDDGGMISSYSGDPHLYNTGTAGAVDSAAGHFLAGIQTYWPEPIIVDHTDPCCSLPPPEIIDTGPGPGPGPGAPPVLTPEIGTQLACAGGGLVPTQPDLTMSELWWEGI